MGFSPGIWPLLMKTSPELKPSSTTSLAICDRVHRSTRTSRLERPRFLGVEFITLHLSPFLAPPSRLDTEFLERFTRTPRSSCFLHFQFRRAMYPQSVRDPSRQNRTRLEHVCRYESATRPVEFHISRRIEHRRCDNTLFERLNVSFIRKVPRIRVVRLCQPLSELYVNYVRIRIMGVMYIIPIL